MKKNILVRVAVLVALTAMATVVIGGPVLAWGPERQTYTNDQPADHVTFNSITDNVAVGDERNFVRVRELGTDSTYVDELEVTPGKEYEVYIYYHNNAASNLNQTGKGIANGVRVASAYPTKVIAGERSMISGIISTTDGDPAKVWDEAYLTSDSDVVLRYKTGTATIHNAGKVNGSILSTNLFTEDGAYIGINTLDGRIPGCAEYSGYITYTLVAENVDSTLEKQVSLDGENWADEVTVKPGDYVTYKVKFNNTGNTTLTNVIFKDTHDEGLSLRAGSTKVFDASNVDGLTIDDIIDISGYNMGDAVAGSLKQVIYQAQVGWDESLCNKTLNNTISVRYNSEDQKSDEATVLVACEVEPAPEEDPDIPEEKTCKTNPEMEGCQELPNTGPLEIVMALVIILGITGGGFYYMRARKTLKTMEGTAKGSGGETGAKDSIDTGKDDNGSGMKNGTDGVS